MDGTGFRHGIRQGVAGGLARVLPGSLYAQYQLDADEFVGTVDSDLEGVTQYLEGEGYAYQVLAARKLHPETEEPDDGSYRLRDPSDPVKQWHVHLWETDSGVELFSHYEYRPEARHPRDRGRVLEHYRPRYGETYIQGQHSEAVKALLEDGGTYSGDAGKLGSTELGPPRAGVRDVFS